MSEVPGGGPRAGWYPDPAAPAPGPLRWWDGRSWTDHVYGGAVPYTAARPAGPTTDDGQELSGWWRRVAALLIDSLVVLVVTLPLTIPAQMSMQREMRVREAELLRRLEAGETPSLGEFFSISAAGYADHWLALLVLPGVVVLAYHAVFLRRRGRTPGKMALGIRVRPRAADGRLGWSVIARRLAVQFVLVQVLQLTVFSGVPTVVVAAAWLVLVVFSLADPLWPLGARRQTLHDRAAGTVVVRQG